MYASERRERFRSGRRGLEERVGAGIVGRGGCWRVQVKGTDIVQAGDGAD